MEKDGGEWGRQKYSIFAACFQSVRTLRCTLLFVILLESAAPKGYDVGGSSAVHAKMPCPENGSRKKKPTKTGWPVHGLGEKRRAARQLRLAKNDCSQHDLF